MFSMILGFAGTLISIIGWFVFSSEYALIFGILLFLIETCMEWNKLNTSAKLLDLTVFIIGYMLGGYFNIESWISGMVFISIYNFIISIFSIITMLSFVSTMNTNKYEKEETNSANTVKNSYNPATQFVGQIPGYMPYNYIIQNNIIRKEIEEAAYISEIAYIPKLSALMVTFRNSNESYLFYGIDEHTWIDFYNSTYKGDFFKYNIQSKYSYQKVQKN